MKALVPTLLLPLFLIAPLAAQQVELKFAPKKDAPVWFQRTVKQAQNIDLGGQEMESGGTIDWAYQVLVKSVADDGTVGLEVRIERIKGSISVPMMGDFEFDSATDKPAAGEAKATLVVVGDGSERGSLERQAGPGVRFMGRISKERLRHLYRTSRLMVFPQVEDFGISAAEALACGLPVVARRAGGALDIVDESCGAFFDEPSPGAIVNAAGRCPRDADACRRRAERFAPEAFDSGLVGVVREMIGSA